MSDLFEVRQKVEEGSKWRGEITVEIDDDTKTLSVRQLRDPEFWEVMSKVDTDELDALQEDLPEDKMEELRELRKKDESEMTEDEEERLSELQEEIEEEDINLFDVISLETYEGLKQAAKYGVEPDGEDVQSALAQHVDEIQQKYGGTSQEDAEQFINDTVIHPMMENSTDFVSFSIGIKVVTETIGETGNLEN